MMLRNKQSDNVTATIHVTIQLTLCFSCFKNFDGKNIMWNLRSLKIHFRITQLLTLLFMLEHNKWRRKVLL